MVRAVLMDVGNVLVNFDLLKLLRAFQRHSDASAFRIVRYLLASKIEDRFERGEMSAGDVWRAAREDLGFQGDHGQFLEAYNAIFHENEEGREVFLALLERLPVYLLSNTNELHFGHLEKAYPWLNRATGKVLSHVVHARKPEAAIYQAALGEAGVRPEEAFYVDDIPKFVTAAGRMGIRGAVFTGAPALKQALRGAGIVL